MRKFFKVYGIPQTLSEEFQFNLSWSHYLILMRIEDINARNFYEIEAFENNWSLRELREFLRIKNLRILFFIYKKLK